MSAYPPRFAQMAVIAVTGFLIGCGSEPSYPRAAVQGMVTANGEPVERGRIMFVPEAGTAGPPTSAAITDGKYEIPKEQGPVIGQMRVEISALRKTGRKVPVPDQPGKEMEEEEQYLPVQFNSQSTLTVNIQEGENSKNFDLEYNPEAGTRRD